MFELSFKTTNASFDDDQHIQEIEKILFKIRDAVSIGNSVGIIRDSNGNTIGAWKYSL